MPGGTKAGKKTGRAAVDSIERITGISLLYDFYGRLLPERQQQAIHLYYEEDLSIMEIAEEFGISRQGAYDALKNAERALEEYENLLGMAERFKASGNLLQELEKDLTEIQEKYQKDEWLRAKTKKMSGLLNEIRER